jgi:hypothetical protein
VVLDCPQPAGWSTGVDAKTADVSEAGHEATGPSEAISLGLPTLAFNIFHRGMNTRVRAEFEGGRSGALAPFAVNYTSVCDRIHIESLPARTVDSESAKCRSRSSGRGHRKREFCRKTRSEGAWRALTEA